MGRRRLCEHPEDWEWSSFRQEDDVTVLRFQFAPAWALNAEGDPSPAAFKAHRWQRMLSLK
jgi:hypothetical protein